MNDDDDAGVQAGYETNYEDVEQVEFDPELLRDKVEEELDIIDEAQDAIDEIAEKEEKERAEREEAEVKAEAKRITEFDVAEFKKLELQKKFYKNLSKNKDLKLQEMFQIEKIIAQIVWQQNAFPRNFEKLKDLITGLEKMRTMN